MPARRLWSGLFVLVALTTLNLVRGTTYNMPDHSKPEVYRRLQCSACSAAVTDVKAGLIAAEKWHKKFKKTFDDMAVYNVFEKVCKDLPEEWGLGQQEYKMEDGSALPEGISFGNSEMVQKFIKGDKVKVKGHLAGKYLDEVCNRVWNDAEEEMRDNYKIAYTKLQKLVCRDTLQVCDPGIHDEL